MDTAGASLRSFKRNRGLHADIQGKRKHETGPTETTHAHTCRAARRCSRSRPTWPSFTRPAPGNTKCSTVSTVTLTHHIFAKHRILIDACDSTSCCSTGGCQKWCERSPHHRFAKNTAARAWLNTHSWEQERRQNALSPTTASVGHVVGTFVCCHVLASESVEPAAAGHPLAQAASWPLHPSMSMPHLSKEAGP